MKCPICDPPECCPVYPHAMAKIVSDPVRYRGFHDQIVAEIRWDTPSAPDAANAAPGQLHGGGPHAISIPPARSYSLLPLVHACQYRKKDEGCGCNGAICTFYNARKSTTECLACMDGGGPHGAGPLEPPASTFPAALG